MGEDECFQKPLSDMISLKKKKEVREGQRGEREGRKEGGEKHLGWNNNYLFLKG